MAVQMGLQMCEEKNSAIPFVPRLASPYSFWSTVCICGSVYRSPTPGGRRGEDGEKGTWGGGEVGRRGSGEEGKWGEGEEGREAGRH